MKKTLKKMTAMAAGLVAMTLAAVAQDSGALVDALVKKGILSDQEAEEIRADLTKEFSQTNAGKINLSSSVTQLRIYGDARVRYQWENQRQQLVTPNVAGSTNSDNTDRNRYRYRVRVGADYVLTDNWKAGVRAESSRASDSTNNNFGRYWDKEDDAFNIGLVYLEYDNTKDAVWGLADNVNARIGKHAHPFLISQQWWDSDLNPEGISEQIGWTDVFTKGLNVTARGGQYVVAEENDSITNQRDDGFLFVNQVEFKYNLNSKTSFAIAPTFLQETSGTFNSPETSSTVALDNENQLSALGNYQVLMLPVEARWVMWNLPNRVYGTYGYNLKGNKLAGDFSGTPANSSSLVREQAGRGKNSFFNLGYALGENRKKGDWSIGAEYVYYEALAYSPNLADSDFAKNRGNQQGIIGRVAYNMSDSVTIGGAYMKSWNIVKDLNIANNNAGDVDLLQVDLAWRF
jgi:polyhydroxyalkanoate synthesis regulator phasin